VITKVRQLTRMNINALRDASVGKNLGATYAEFDLSPTAALVQVEEAMRNCPGINTTYRSLQAVQRKLKIAAGRYAALGMDDTRTVNLTPYVSINR
jgi:hypothetical protein